MTGSPLPYLIIDADQHSTHPDDAFERYVDPKQRDKAVRNVRGPDGAVQTLYAGRPMRMPPKSFQANHRSPVNAKSQTKSIHHSSAMIFSALPMTRTAT